MTRGFSSDQVTAFAKFYAEHGAVRLPGFIEPEWVTRVLEEIRRAETAYTPNPAPGSEISYGRGKGRMTIRNMFRGRPLIREFLYRPELVEPIARIVDSHTLQFWFDLTFIHEASEPGEPGEGSRWHHDIAAFAFKGEKLPSLWMAMTPATIESSRIEFIDGSHRTAPGYYSPPSGGRPDDGLLTVPDFDAFIASGKERVLTWDCDAGDAIVIHPYAIHGAKGNAGAVGHGRRVAITTRWLGDDVRWLPLDPNAGRSAAGIGSQPPPLGSRPSTERFPVVYSGRAAAAGAADDRRYWDIGACDERS